MAESVVTDEMKALIGVERTGGTAEVTTTGIRMFARAVGHTDPIFYDEAAAKTQGYRGLVAPPGYLGTAIGRPPARGTEAGGGEAGVPPGMGGPPIPYKRVLNGGTRYEYMEPIIAGDVITSTSRLTEYREREGSMGPMLITYRETTYTNQHGVAVARETGNIIQY